MKALIAGFRARAAGYALAMTLVFLTVLSALALAALSTQTLESRMASNLADYERARQSAETAVAAGERWLDAQPAKPAAATGCTLSGRCSSANPVWDASKLAVVSDWWRFDWPRNAQAYAGLSASTVRMTRVAAPPRFLIEQLGDSTGTPILSLYRITGYGTGSSADMVAIVQSTYARAYCCAAERPRRDRRVGRIGWRELSPP